MTTFRIDGKHFFYGLWAQFLFPRSHVYIFPYSKNLYATIHAYQLTSIPMVEDEVIEGGEGSAEEVAPEGTDEVAE